MARGAAAVVAGACRLGGFELRYLDVGGAGLVEREGALAACWSTRFEDVPPVRRFNTSLAAGQHVVVQLADGQILLRIDGVQEDKGGRYPTAVAVQWDGTERSLRNADRLPTMGETERRHLSSTSPRATEGEARGFVLVGAEPTSLQVLPTVVGPRTPVPKWTSAWVVSWVELGLWFVDSATPKSPWTETNGQRE